VVGPLLRVAQLKAARKDTAIKVFEGKGHGFMNPNNKQGYDLTAATDAWSRIDAFFARTSKGT
jgi:dienelactone hydrolase